MTRALALVLLLTGCVDIPTAHEQFCEARPELCCPGSDDFTRSELGPCWQNLEPSAIEPRPLFAGGKLVVVQRPNWSWSSGQRGFLLYQTLTGNFVVETSAKIGELNGGVGFSNEYTAAALIAFHPGTGGASHVVSVGSIANADPSGVLTEFTNDAGVTSPPRFQPGTGFAAELRLCRVGNSVSTYFRAPDAGNGVAPVPPGVRSSWGRHGARDVVRGPRLVPGRRLGKRAGRVRIFRRAHRAHQPQSVHRAALIRASA